MKEYRNFILVDNDKSVITATYANCSSEVSYKKYAKRYIPTKISNNNIDSLLIINKHMSQILKWKKEDVALSLNSDVEYLKINDDLQKMIQEEMMRSVKIKINSNPDAITKMERLKSLISTAKKQKSDEERKILADMNDYVKNYSDLTFEEYKQLKYGNK